MTPTLSTSRGGYVHKYHAPKYGIIGLLREPTDMAWLENLNSITYNLPLYSAHSLLVP